jgi:hypothetical protein
VRVTKNYSRLSPRNTRKGPKTAKAIAKATETIRRVNAAGLNRRPFDVALTELRRITAFQPQTREVAERVLDLLAGEGIGHIRPADTVTVELLAVLLRRIAQADVLIDQFGLLRKRGEEVRPVAAFLVTMLREARGYIETLGLSPKARAALGVDTARALDAYEELSRLREERAPADGSQEPVGEGPGIETAAEPAAAAGSPDSPRETP